MAISVQMPALGESVTEGTVTRWLKQEGDTVEQDEPLLEVSTDKVDTEIPSPAAGVLQKIVAQEDDTVEVGGELAKIGDADAAAESEPEPEPEPEPAPPEPEPEIVEPPMQPAENVDFSRASTEEMTIRMEGLRQDYPQYYENIVRQISACFRWTGGAGRWVTIIRFEIQRDGTIPGSSIQLYQRSGNGTFDIQAFGAVECAGAGRLSPLPEDLPYDALPIQFTFRPA
jgi:hypothetical protein